MVTLKKNLLNFVGMTQAGFFRNLSQGKTSTKLSIFYFSDCDIIIFFLILVQTTQDSSMLNY